MTRAQNVWELGWELEGYGTNLWPFQLNAESVISHEKRIQHFWQYKLVWNEKTSDRLIVQDDWPIFTKFTKSFRTIISYFFDFTNNIVPFLEQWQTTHFMSQKQPSTNSTHFIYTCTGMTWTDKLKGTISSRSGHGIGVLFFKWTRWVCTGLDNMAR